MRYTTAPLLRPALVRLCGAWPLLQLSYFVTRLRVYSGKPHYNRETIQSQVRASTHAKVKCQKGSATTSNVQSCCQVQHPWINHIPNISWAHRLKRISFTAKWSIASNDVRCVLISTWKKSVSCISYQWVSLKSLTFKIWRQTEPL